jgi:hypothetical protein
MSKETVSNRICSSQIMRDLEAIVGKRFCKRCNAMVPLDQFRQTNTRYLCDTHRRQAQRDSEFGTVERRALSTLCAKSQGDRKIFGHTKMFLRKRDLTPMLKPEQIQNYSEWAIIPRDPAKETSTENAEVVTVYQRRCLVRNWKKHRNPEQYMDLLRRSLAQTPLCAE